MGMVSVCLWNDWERVMSLLSLGFPIFKALFSFPGCSGNRSTMLSVAPPCVRTLAKSCFGIGHPKPTS